MENYKEIARQARIKTLELVWKAQTSHIGSNFSAIDIMTVLFDKVDTNKDEIILSKGWAAAAWYYFLWRNGIITEEELNSFCQEGSPFIGLVEPMNRWGLRCAGGSMGMGISFAVGFALSKKLKGEEGKVYCLMSDGEMQIGTTWESALIANQHFLSNLIVLVDNNKFCAMGKTSDILNINPLRDKWESFGWNFLLTDGHDYFEIEKQLDRAFNFGGPTIIVANTIKGRGVSFMENNNDYHYIHLSDEDYYKALEELNL